MSDPTVSELRDVIQILLDSAHREIVRESYPSIIDGLTPFERSVLFLLEDVETLSRFSLLRSLASIHPQLSVAALARSLDRIVTSPLRYPLIEAIEEDGRLAYRIAPLVRCLLISLDRDFPMENPALVRLPLLLCRGWHSSDSFIPPHPASDVVQFLIESDTSLLPDLSHGEFIALESSESGEHLISMGSLSRVEHTTYRVISLPLFVTSESLCNRLRALGSEGEARLVSEDPENLLIQLNSADRRSMNAFVEGYLTTCVPISRIVYDDTDRTLKSASVSLIVQTWQTHHETMFSGSGSLEADLPTDPQPLSPISLQRLKADLRISFSDRRHCTYVV